MRLAELLPTDDPTTAPAPNTPDIPDPEQPEPLSTDDMDANRLFDSDPHNK